MPTTNANSTNEYGPPAFIVDPTVGNGTHTTIGAALTAAVSGQDIFIRPGTYTENPTLKTGVNLIGFKGDDTTPQVTIAGNCTYTGGGTVSLSNLLLQTNSASCLTFSGSTGGTVYIDHCLFNVTNATGITFSNSVSTSILNLDYCSSLFGSTSEALFAMSATGTFNFNHCNLLNSQATYTASTQTAGVCTFNYTNFQGSINQSTGGTGELNAFYSQFNGSPNGQNALALTINGNGGSQTLVECYLNGGTSSALSVGLGPLTMIGGDVISSATHAITGVGEIIIANVSFGGTSSNINTSTVVIAPSSPVTTTSIIDTGIAAFSLVAGGTSTTAPLQDIASVASGSVLISNGTAALPAWSTTPSVTGITIGGGTQLTSFSQTTWTPTVVGSSTAGTTTYTLQFGEYTKIGSMIFLSYVVECTTGSTASGTITLGGLPATANATPQFMGITTSEAALTFTSGYTYIGWQTNASASTALLVQQGSAKAPAVVSITASTAYTFSGTAIYSM